jgi:A/G-specific adenine glycosylase
MKMTVDEFNEILWKHYADHGRHDLAWRQPNAAGQYDPYAIVVSELMLQQTQVTRVTGKYQAFLMQFPTVQDLAAADLAAVLVAWSGLGYNRRAKYLWQTARLVSSHGGKFPQTLEGLVSLPGIGKNTAGAVLAYAFNVAQPFIETNVRTVYIHHFFNDADGVTDTDILALLNQTIDREHPREFYWALMDYGSYIKQTVGNASRASKDYKKQTVFEGSKRQIRGRVIKTLAGGPMSLTQLTKTIEDKRLNAVLNDLVAEQMISVKNDNYSL